MDANDLVIRAVSPELYTGSLEGHEVGRVRVAVGDGLWEVYSTQVDQAHEGRGIAGRMVAHVLEQAEAAGVRVVPSCWYVDGFMTRRSPRYDHLRATGAHGYADPACRIAPAVVRSE